MSIERVVTGPNILTQPTALPSLFYSDLLSQVYSFTALLNRYRNFENPESRPTLQTINLVNSLRQDQNFSPYTPPTRPQLWQQVEQSIFPLIASLNSLPPNDFSFALRDYLIASQSHPNPTKPLIGLTYDKHYDAIVRPLIIYLNYEDQKRFPKQPQFSY